MRAAPPPDAEATVTDHALVRYLQRVVGLDVNRLRQEMLSDGRAALVQQMQNGRLHTAEGAVLIVCNCRVVSVVRAE